MPIATVPLTDTFDQWRQKTNSMIEVVNTLTGSGTVLSIDSQIAGQLLISDGTVFRNVTVTGDVLFASDGTSTLVGGANSLTRGRVRFSSSMAGLY